MSKLMSIKEASAELGVSQGTLRRWEKEKYNQNGLKVVQDDTV
jgi:transposase